MVIRCSATGPPMMLPATRPKVAAAMVSSSRALQVVHLAEQPAVVAAPVPCPPDM